jgi:hypothetical protein
MMQWEIPVKTAFSFFISHINQSNRFSVVIGASEHTCHSIDDVVSLLKKGSNVRHTGATQMNDESSRSHAIFTLYIGMNFIK